MPLGPGEVVPLGIDLQPRLAQTHNGLQEHPSASTAIPLQD
jgi:hypothetical protein